MTLAVNLILTESKAGQSPSAIPPSSMPILSDVVSEIRMPEILSTSGYENNPIQFEVPLALIPQSSIQEIASGSIPQYPRDISSFVVVSQIPQSVKLQYSIFMNSPIYDPSKVTSVFKSQFVEF